MAKHSRLHSGHPVAAAGAAGGNRIVVAHQPAAEVGEDRRTGGEARAVLMADAGGRAPDESPVLDDFVQDGAAAASGNPGGRQQSWQTESHEINEEEPVSKKLKRMALDDEGELMTAENHPYFPRQMLFWSCNLSRELYKGRIPR